MDLSSVSVRPDVADSDRTRLLKEILRSSQNTLGGSPTRSAGWRAASGDGAVNDVKDASSPSSPSRGERSGPRLPAVGRSRSIPGLRPGRSAPEAQVAELAPVLRSCDERIQGLFARLRSAEQLVPGAQLCQRPSEDNSVSIVDCPDVSPNILRSRADRAAASYLAQHARFKALEDLEEALEQCEGLEDLRQVFPQKFRYHPNLFLLTDQTLRSRGDFRRAMWHGLSSGEDISMKRTMRSHGRSQKPSAFPGGREDPNQGPVPLMRPPIRARGRLMTGTQREHSWPRLT